MHFTSITCHCCHAPDVGTCPPLGAENDFRRSILTGLDVIGKVMAHPACISQICNLHRDRLDRRCDFLVTFLGHRIGRSSLVERNARDILGKNVTNARLAVAPVEFHHPSYAVFSRCFCTSSPFLPELGSRMPSISRIDFGGVAEAITPLVNQPLENQSETKLPGLSFIIWFKLLCDPLMPLENLIVSMWLKLALRGLGRGWLPVIKVLLRRLPLRLSSLSSGFGSSLTNVFTMCSTSPISINTFSGFRSVWMMPHSRCR